MLRAQCTSGFEPQALREHEQGPVKARREAHLASLLYLHGGIEQLVAHLTRTQASARIWGFETLYLR